VLEVTTVAPEFVTTELFISDSGVPMGFLSKVEVEEGTSLNAGCFTDFVALFSKTGQASVTPTVVVLSFSVSQDLSSISVSFTEISSATLALPLLMDALVWRSNSSSGTFFSDLLSFWELSRFKSCCRPVISSSCCFEGSFLVSGSFIRSFPITNVATNQIKTGRATKASSRVKRTILAVSRVASGWHNSSIL